MEEIKYIKAFDKGLTCLDFSFSMEKTNFQSGEIKLYSNGLHYCTDIADTLDNYEPVYTEYAIVKPSPEAEVLTDGTVYATNALNIVKKLSIDECLKYDPTHIWAYSYISHFVYFLGQEKKETPDINNETIYKLCLHSFEYKLDTKIINFYLNKLVLNKVLISNIENKYIIPLIEKFIENKENLKFSMISYHLSRLLDVLSKETIKKIIDSECCDSISDFYKSYVIENNIELKEFIINTYVNSKNVGEIYLTIISCYLDKYAKAILFRKLIDMDDDGKYILGVLVSNRNCELVSYALSKLREIGFNEHIITIIVNKYLWSIIKSNKDYSELSPEWKTKFININELYYALLNSESKNLYLYRSLCLMAFELGDCKDLSNDIILHIINNDFNIKEKADILRQLIFEKFDEGFIVTELLLEEIYLAIGRKLFLENFSLNNLPKLYGPYTSLNHGCECKTENGINNYNILDKFYNSKKLCPVKSKLEKKSLFRKILDFFN